MDRLTERVDRIERERWEERQRAFERNCQILMAIIWLIAIATVVLAAVERASG